jgi:hypothetical protein
MLDGRIESVFCTALDGVRGALNEGGGVDEGDIRCDPNSAVGSDVAP